MLFDSEGKLHLFGVFGILCFIGGVIALIAGTVYLFQGVQIAREVEAEQRKKEAETQTRVLLRNSVDEYRSQLPRAVQGITGAQEALEGGRDPDGDSGSDSDW